MEEAKEAIEEILKTIGKVLKKIIFIILVLISFLIILLPCAVYWLTVDDGTYEEDEWSNVPFAAAQYTNSTVIDENGKLTSNNSAQELWDKMIENNSRVDEYLDSPEELARLMKAEIVTQYPDTRPNPDEEIDWEEIFENPDEFQGIIKFKRANSNNNILTMTYVDSDTFYDWIELYEQTGNEYYKNQALTHFTLSKNESASSSNSDNSSTESDYTTNDIKTNCSDAIVKAAKEVGSPGAGLCQKWVRLVYAKAGLGNASYATAYQAFKNNCVSTRKDNIPIGAAVYGTGSGSSAGHVGIYIGNGQVMDNIGYIRTQSLDDWIAWQERHSTVIPGEKPGWLGWGWQSGSPKILDTESNDNNQSNSNEDTTEDTTDSNEVNTEETTSKDSYTAVIATWQQVDTTVTTNVENSTQTQYSMTTTNVNYEEMVKKYTMPFDLLWAFLVVGEGKNFVFELADLVYGSDIQITIHDNLTVNTDIDEWNYTQRTKAIVNADIVANCKDKSIADSIKNDVHDPDKVYDDPDNIKDKPYKTTKTVVTQTNTVDVALTRANTWIVDYQNDYTYVAPKETKTTDEVRKDNEEYKEQPDNIGDSYSCIHINMKKEELKKKMQELNAQSSDSDTDMSIETMITQLAPVVFNEKIKVEYYNKYINISDTVTNKVNTQEYTQGTPTVREKTDPKAEDEENFSTIFNKYEHRKNKSNIKDASSWLFEIIETNESTADMSDLVRYLLYKATGTSYGVKEYDFSEYDASKFTSVSTNITGNTIQEKVWFGLKAVGYSDVSVAAAMGNIHYESGTFDPKKVEGGYNENNGGIGICQWTNNNRGSQGRNTNLRKYAKSKGKTWQDEDIQVEFLIAEVTKNCKTDASKYAGFAFLNSTYTGTPYRYSEWTDAKDSDSLDKNQLNRLTEVFCFTFERPNAAAGRSSMSTRQKYALQYYKQFHGKEAPTTSGSSIEVANGTAQQKLKYLFPNGTPTSASQAKQYMATVDVPITTKSGTKTTAKLTIHKQLVSDVQDVFKTAQDNGFRIYSAGGYKFRPMNNGGSGKLSHHSYGVAIDINPNENYSHRGNTVYAGSFWNPSKSQYSIPKDGILVKAFKAKGWKWGGNWSGSYQDYMHFSFTGN